MQVPTLVPWKVPHLRVAFFSSFPFLGDNLFSGASPKNALSSRKGPSLCLKVKGWGDKQLL